MALDWSILRSNGPVDIAGNFARGYEMSTKIISDIRQRQALGELAADPDNPNALAALYRTNPEMGMRMETMNVARHKTAREAAARNALGDIVADLGGQQYGDFWQPNAISGRMPEPHIEAPSVAGPGGTTVDGSAVRGPGVSVDVPPQGNPVPKKGGPPPAGPEGAITITASRLTPPEDVGPDHVDAWRTYAQNDPTGAFKMLLGRQKLDRAQAAAKAAQFDIIGRIAGTATDEDSYQKALNWGRGLGFDTSHLPKNFSPEAVVQIQQQSMTAKDLLKLQNDITDDEIDNARADQVAEWAHQDRQRGQDIGSADRRRGQDMRGQGKGARAPAPKPPTPTTVIGKIMDKQARGEELTPAERTTMDEYRAKKGGGKGGGMLRVKSVAEARALPKGTKFIDPSGTIRVR